MPIFVKLNHYLRFRRLHFWGFYMHQSQSSYPSHQYPGFIFNTEELKRADTKSTLKMYLSNKRLLCDVTYAGCAGSIGLRFYSISKDAPQAINVSYIIRKAYIWLRLTHNATNEDRKNAVFCRLLNPFWVLTKFSSLNALRIHLQGAWTKSTNFNISSLSTSDPTLHQLSCFSIKNIRIRSIGKHLDLILLTHPVPFWFHFAKIWTFHLNFGIVSL